MDVVLDVAYMLDAIDVIYMKNSIKCNQIGVCMGLMASINDSCV